MEQEKVKPYPLWKKFLWFLLGFIIGSGSCYA